MHVHVCLHMHTSICICLSCICMSIYLCVTNTAHKTCPSAFIGAHNICQLCAVSAAALRNSLPSISGACTLQSSTPHHLPSQHLASPLHSLSYDFDDFKDLGKYSIYTQWILEIEFFQSKEVSCALWWACLVPTLRRQQEDWEVKAGLRYGASPV